MARNLMLVATATAMFFSIVRTNEVPRFTLPNVPGSLACASGSMVA